MSNIKLDFQIYDRRDPNRFYVIDTSEWGVLENKPAIIEITPPNYKDNITQYYKKNSLNLFNSNSLGISCNTCGDTELVELSDGIYNIILKASPDTINVEKIYFRTVALDLKIDKLMVEATSNYKCGETNLDDVIEFKVLLKAAEANAVYGNVETAMEIYNDINSKVDKYNKCKTCR